MGTRTNNDILESVVSVVLAGGQGTRLFPLTHSRCKPSVSFGGRYRLIDIPLSNSLNSGIKRVCVISQYFASNLHQHIMSTYPMGLFHWAAVEMLCPEESPNGKVWFQGTADAVRQNLDHLLKTDAEYFLILSGDQLYNMDFRKMVEFASEKDADLVIASIPVKESDAKRMGVLKIDHLQKVEDFIEKPQDPKSLLHFSKQEAGTTSFLASMGIYIFKKEALVSLLKHEGQDFGHHLIPEQVRRGKTYSYVYDDYWVDIGTIASFYEANMALLDQQKCLNTKDDLNPIYSDHQNLPCPIIRNCVVTDSIISPGSIVEAEEISKSVVGMRSQISKGTKVSRSVIMGNRISLSPHIQKPQEMANFSIGENCIIDRAIIDENSYVGNGVHLTNKDNIQHFDGEDICIRDGIIIVRSGAVIPDGFML